MEVEWSDSHGLAIFFVVVVVVVFFFFFTKIRIFVSVINKERDNEDAIN